MRRPRSAAALALSALAAAFGLAPGLAPAPASAADCDGRLVEGPMILGGPVCVPVDPQRILVLDPTFSLGMGLELGLPLVGAPLVGMSDDALRARAEAAGVESIGAFVEPSLETVAALQPDLILGAGMLGETALAMASRIAPTVLIGAENWKDYYRILARATGRGAEAEAILAEYEARAQALRARVSRAPVSVLRITTWDFQVYLDSPRAYGPFLVLRDAGVVRPPFETAQGDETLRRPDWEELAGLSGETLLYIVGGANDSDTNGRLDEVLAHPLWRALPAVKAGRAHRVDAGTWMEFSGAASAHRVLDDVERYLLAAE
ncbi:MAG: iron-siderophore ABC transporter substrate-binding protein [Pseudomonadota bacterium]|nr:iron-siderophore ABC transporter substrate-binding protein [Pseudomonadota bacterium]MEE3101916.1 iron-siderophore ABC transporter substrate-binding protein [Pseudomonadota bacterium]